MTANIPVFCVHNEKEIKGFFGPYRFLSNFYPAEVRADGLIFPSVETAYQYMKTTDEDQKNLIVNAGTVVDARRLGRNVTLRPSWELIKVDLMTALVFQKFSNNEELRKKLLDTGSSYLEETNYWKDSFWGVDTKIGGKNLLGSILMRVRLMV